MSPLKNHVTILSTNRTMRTKIQFMIIALVIGLSLKAQTVAEVLKEVNAKYSGTENVSMDIKYELFTNYSAVLPYESSSGSYVKQGSSYYSNLLGITTVQNKKYAVSVSESDQMIVVSNPVKTGKAPSLVETDSLLKRCTSTEVKKTAEGVTTCILHFENAPFCEFDRIEIEVGTNSFITSMTLFYREAVNLNESDPQLKKEKPKLVISYSNINTNPVIKADQFSERTYIIDNGEKITGASAYSTYRILNHKK